MTEKELLETFPSGVLEELAKADTGEKINEIAEKYGYKLPTLMNARTALKNGEKKKTVNRKRTKQFSIRMTEEEYNNVQAKLEQSGMSQREYVVKALLECEVTNTDGVKELLPQLGKVGSNLNQIARKLNENGYVDYKGELADALKGVNEIWQLLKQSIQELQ